MSIFSLGNAFLTAFSLGDSLFGGSGGPPPGHPEYNIGANRSSSAMGFIQKGAKMFLESQGDSADKPFSSAEFQRPRSVKELTRGAPALTAERMPVAQQQLYQMPQVAQYWDRLLASQNQQVRNVMAAADVQETLPTGRKTKVLGTETTLKGEIGVS